MKHINVRTGQLMLAFVLTALYTTSAAWAVHQKAKVDVTGKWAFSVETSAGSGTPTFVFKQDGETLTGHYSGQLGEAELTGTVKGDAISFTFTGDVQGTKVDAVYTGTVETKDSMKGTVKLVGFGEGTFTGKRQ